MKNVITVKSRAAARTMKAELIAKGFEDAKVVDNGADSENRWTVEYLVTETAVVSAENFEKVEQAIAEPAAPAPALVELLKRETLTVKRGALSGRKGSKWEFVNPNHGKQQRRKEKKAPILAKKNRQPVKENALTLALQVAFNK
ncbi:MAG: hypothetical protein ACRDCI_09285 [Plesiomonas shigelloides]